MTGELRERIAAEVRRGWPKGTGKKKGGLLVADRILRLIEPGEPCPSTESGNPCTHSKGHEGLHFDGLIYWDDENADATPIPSVPEEE